MKKILTIAIILTSIISCSNSNEETLNNNTDKYLLNPPAWIQGKWGHNIIEEMGYIFKEHDYCDYSPQIVSCLEAGKMDYNEFKDFFSEKIGEDFYKIEIKLYGTTVTLHFKKISNTKIMRMLTETDGEIYVKK